MSLRSPCPLVWSRPVPLTLARWLGMFVLLGGMLGEGGCRADTTELVLVVDSDLATPTELDRVQLTLGGPTQSLAPIEIDFKAAGAPSFALTMGMTPAGGLSPVNVHVAGYLNDEMRVSQDARTAFVDGSSRLLSVTLSLSCAGMTCPMDETCSQGSCVSMDRAATSLPLWTGQPPARVDERPKLLGGRSLWSAGWHSCATKGDSLYCWGSNSSGQLGDGTTTSTTTRRAVLPLPGALGPVVSVAVGYNHTCVCDSSGQAWCWGSNSDGQLGTGDTKNQSKPTLVEGISDCVQIAAGGFHTCVKRKAGNGTVTCWGRNAEGQIGTAVSTTPVTRPKDVAGLNAVVEVHCGEKFTCTRTTASAVMCWGDNSQGQLGDGTTTTRDVPARVVNIPTSPSPAGEVATGRFFACARMTSGEVWCWGANLKGAYGTTSPVKSPVQLPNLEKVTQVAAGHDHACFLQVSGAVSCVGSNQYGQLGDGTGLNAIVPVPVLDIPSDATSISAGTVHSCARRSTGTVCWGQNILGQLGDGSTADELRPVAVVGF